jgi:alkanesulfonate monooxygenase SsuD/methylene tetrahydromethanopterin reductase-like flavin-dependent oxidoreductase (luciferase family)
MTAHPSPRIGIAFVPTLAPERLRSLATAADAARLDELWVWEDCFKQSGIASAAAALAWTDQLTVGIGLLPVPLRNVALTAMELATLERMAPGRLVAGIGHGVQPWMEQVGARVESPLTLLREYTDALRRLLDGETVTATGRYVTLTEVALDWPPVAPPPLMLGGTGPRSLALAAELGDGLLLANDRTLAEVEQAAGVVGRGAAASRKGRRAALVATLIVATGPGAEQRVAEEIPRWGRSPEPGMGAAGDAATIGAGIRRLAASGATSVCLQPTEDEPDLLGLVRFLGEEVRPLVLADGG